MASGRELFRQISSGAYDDALARLYGGGAMLARQRARYCDALLRFETYYGHGRQVRVFSVPGRAELGGNHTDQQNGVALAAAVDLDIVVVAAAAAVPQIRVKSYGFDKLDVIDLTSIGLRAGEVTFDGSPRDLTEDRLAEIYGKERTDETA